MPSVLLLWMIAIEQLIHRPINWDRVWHLEIIASTGDCAGEADKQKTSAAIRTRRSTWKWIHASVSSRPRSEETGSLDICVFVDKVLENIFKKKKERNTDKEVLSVFGFI